jgi:hypothetical protein
VYKFTFNIIWFDPLNCASISLIAVKQGVGDAAGTPFEVLHLLPLDPCSLQLGTISESFHTLFSQPPTCDTSWSLASTLWCTSQSLLSELH